MATAIPVASPGQPGAAPSPAMIQNANQPLQQNVYMMPVPQGGSTRVIRPVPGVKCLSITLVVLGGVLVILGIAAIVLKANASYVGNPIWTGLLVRLCFFMLTL